MARESQLESIKSGPFLKGAILKPLSRQEAARPKETMVFPEPPFRAAMMIRGIRFGIVYGSRKNASQIKYFGFLRMKPHPKKSDYIHLKNKMIHLDLVVKYF